MQYKQFKDGSCDITYTWKERFRIFFKGKIHLKADMFKHSCNIMFGLLVKWQQQFDERVQKILTRDNQIIDSE